MNESAGQGRGDPGRLPTVVEIVRPSEKVRMARALLACALTLAAGLVRAHPARAASTYYVSVSGSNGSPGTLGAPWRTVDYGLRQLFPGDSLLVRGGTYVERVTSVTFRPATSNSPITVAAYPGERPIVKGVLQIRGANYWTFDGINATWDPATGTPADPIVKIMHGVGWTYKNAEIWGARSYAGMYIGSAVVGQPSNWRIAGNCIHDTYAAHDPFLDHNLYIGLKTEDAPGPGLVERNVMFNASNGENIKVGGGSVGGAEDVLIRYNTLYNAAQNVMVVAATERTTLGRNLMGKATGKWWYPNVRGHNVTGTGNVAVENVGFAADKFLLSTGGTHPIVNGGGNVFGIDPKFASQGCTGFRPTVTALKMYGAWSPSGVPLGGDWDGDGTETAGFRRVNVWYLNDAFDASVDVSVAYGKPTDLPVVGDWDGDGDDTPGVVRGNAWYLDNGTDGVADVAFSFAKPTDVPVVGDWDGDGDDTPGAVRGNVWYINNGFGPYASASFAYGAPTDVRVAGDWNGDGVDSPGVVRGNVWYLNDGFGPYASVSFAYGSTADVPVVGDWDGDGSTTIGMVRATSWFLRNTNSAGVHDIFFSDEGWL